MARIPAVASQMMTSVRVPTRICLSGENLDWIGGQSACLAIDQGVQVSLFKRSGAVPEDTDPPFQWIFAEVERLLNVNAASLQYAVTFEVPPAAGLATSSAFTLGVAMLLNAQFGLGLSGHQMLQVAYEAEFVRTRGGGMDHTSVLYGGLSLVSGRRHGLPSLLSSLEVDDSLIVVLIDTGLRKDCVSTVSSHRRSLEQDQLAFSDYRSSTSSLAADVVDAIASRDYRSLNELINRSHQTYVEHMDASTREIEGLRDRLLEAGLSNCKLTGSGKGGMLFSLCPESSASRLRARLDTVEGVHPIYGVRIARPTTRGMPRVVQVDESSIVEGSSDP